MRVKGEEANTNQCKAVFVGSHGKRQRFWTCFKDVTVPVAKHWRLQVKTVAEMVLSGCAYLEEKLSVNGMIAPWRANGY